MGTKLRILGVGRAIDDFRRKTTRNSGLFAALDDRFEVVGTIEPELRRGREYAAIARYVYPSRDGWRARAGLNPGMFRSLTASLEKLLERWDGAYDLIVQTNLVFAPGQLSRNRPYVVYTDNIHALTARYFPNWAPLSRRDRARRMDLERATCNAARVVFAKSHLLRDALIEDYGCDPDSVVWAGAGSNSVVPSIADKRYDTQTALFVGIHFERKGGDTLLESWPLVRERLPDARLAIVGPRKRPAAADQPGIDWHGFVADRERLVKLYSEATAFVLPALFEPLGTVIAEAKGEGLPCIVTDRGGLGELVEEGVDGLHVPAGEPQPLAKALVDMLSDSQRAADMGRRAHEDVVRNRTWERVVERMAPLLERAADHAEVRS